MTPPTSFLRAPGGLETGLAEWIRRRDRSPLREMVALVSRPGILSLAGGLPAGEFFPRREYATALEEVIAGDERAFQYAPPFEPLRERIVELMAARGVRCSREEIFLTAGAQQAIDILTKLLLEPGGRIVLEEITYTGAQQAIAPFSPEVLTVRTDLHSGMDVAGLEEVLERGPRPAFIYAIPHAHNPWGVSLGARRRRRLVELAREHHVPIVEDDAYGFLHYGSPAGEERTPGEGDARRAAPLRALDDDWVVYVGSFSKIIAPALRLGWMVLPERLVSRATIAKEASDLECSALTQRAVAAYLGAGHLPRHLERLREGYRVRRDAMLRSLERFFPETARWSRPSGGMFVWVELPPAVDCDALMREALEEESVAFLPGRAFSVSGRAASSSLRLSFSTSKPEEIEEGVRRIARLLRRRI